MISAARPGTSTARRTRASSGLTDSRSALDVGSTRTVLVLPASCQPPSELPLYSLIAAVANIRRSTAGANKSRTSLRNDIACASGDSSADEDVEHPSTAPAPDAGVAYSFDAPRGPSQGSQILGPLLDQAMERFEVRQTDKLIRDEYEVLEADAEAVTPGPRVVRKGLTPEDEEYLFVDA